MIPEAVIAALASTPASEQLRDAGQELAFRIAQGEFDALGETRCADLSTLAQMLGVWAGRAAALEEAQARVTGEDVAAGADAGPKR